MTLSCECCETSGDYDHRYFSAIALPQGIWGSTALACVAFACAWMLSSLLAGTSPPADSAQAVQPRPSPAAVAYAKLSAALNRAELAAALHRTAKLSANLINDVALFDARHSLGIPPGTFSRSADLEADNQPAASAAGRSVTDTAPKVSAKSAMKSAIKSASEDQAAPRRSPLVRHAALQDDAQASAAADAPAKKPSLFEWLFGKPASMTLAYASPDDGVASGPGITPGRYDQWTAVYDISAHTVYMPDGTKLEAHSGLGARLDDPRHADERMRGVTPPDVYDLSVRDGLFHGVRALRLTPVDETKVFGRSGLLAHTYMLGPRGDSNGCVSFKNYDAFLHAYLNHRIKRLAVVARLDN